MSIEILFHAKTWLRLLEGLWVTLRISLLTTLFSVMIGLLLGVLASRKNPVARMICRVHLEIVRIVPQLVLLFAAFFGLSRLWDIQLPGEVVAIIVFTFWASGEMGDLVRGAMASIPATQTQSGLALGLSGTQIFTYIILPQTVRRLAPPVINLITRIIKTTSLISLIGMMDVFKVGKQIIDFNRFQNPKGAFWIYATIFFLYFALCYPISKLSRLLEKRWKD
jgi:polar amino acid transport system permease protein